jgi:hypothetical protein
LGEGGREGNPVSAAVPQHWLPLKSIDIFAQAGSFMRMKVNVKRQARWSKLRIVGKRGATQNGHMHVVSPATASEIRAALNIRSSHIRNALSALKAAGIKV